MVNLDDRIEDKVLSDPIYFINRGMQLGDDSTKSKITVTPEQEKLLKYFVRKSKVSEFLSKRIKSGMTTGLFMVYWLLANYYKGEVHCYFLYDKELTPRTFKYIDTLMRSNFSVYESNIKADGTEVYGYSYDLLTRCDFAIYDIHKFIEHKHYKKISPNSVMLIDDFDYLSQYDKQDIISHCNKAGKIVLATSP